MTGNGVVNHSDPRYRQIWITNVIVTSLHFKKFSPLLFSTILFKYDDIQGEESVSEIKKTINPFSKLKIAFISDDFNLCLIHLIYLSKLKTLTIL